MIRALFGDCLSGRLGRLSYLGYSLCISLSLFVFMLLTVLLIGVAEHLIGGNLSQAQDQIRLWFSWPYLLIFGVFMAAIVFSGLNITAKRLRDIGLPGWSVIFAVILAELLLNIFASNVFAAVLHCIFCLIILTYPGQSKT